METKETRWTPGPWKIHADEQIVDKLCNVAVVVKLGNDGREANAHLIATAPELYAALADAAEAFEALASGRDIAAINLDVYKHWQTILAAARGEK